LFEEWRTIILRLNKHKRSIEKKYCEGREEKESAARHDEK